MTKAELISDLKNLIGPAVEVDDGGLAVWINDAYMQIVDEIAQETPDFFIKKSTTSSIDGQQEYELPSDFESISMVNIQIDGTWKRVEPLGDADIRHIEIADDPSGFTWSHPKYYIKGDNIGFAPIPNETTSNNIKIWYEYTPTELDDDSDEPDIPKKYHHIIKYGAYANYLDQDDEHVAAERMRQRFDKKIQDMVNRLTRRQTDVARSVTITQGKDLFRHNAIDDFVV